MHRMQPRFFHGDIRPVEVAEALLAEFNRGNLEAQAIGDEDKVVVQIRTHSASPSGGQTALTVSLDGVEDGVMVQLGSQAWLGVAASLGVSALATLRNPLSLLGRLDDIAQDLESLQLSNLVWQVVERFAAGAGASLRLSERLQRVTCEYCGTANPVGEGACMACGAPLGTTQPRTCPNCGFLTARAESRCSNCGYTLRW